MTTEEKAKAYDEALTKAKEMMNNSCSSETTKAVCQELFTELTESEDERIRKHIIDIIKDNAKSKCIPCDAEIAYLEKQKPSQTDTEKEYVRTLKSLISDFLHGKQEVDTGYYRQIYDWLDEIHIEQRSVEKQDYSGLNDFEKAIHRGFLAAGVENVPVTIIKETAKECLAQMKPAEHSEENITNEWKGEDLERYLSCLQRLGTGNPQQPETINSKWFKKHCCPQPQKQEWSDEDKQCFDEAIEALESLGFDGEASNLKSLRNYRKPLNT